MAYGCPANGNICFQNRYTLFTGIIYIEFEAMLSPHQDLDFIIRRSTHIVGDVMRIFLRFALLLAATLAVHSALAEGRVFPPDDCTAAAPFMAFTGADGSNTYCNTGQDIFHNALPVCGPEQVVSYNGVTFYCRDLDNNVPTCVAGQFLTYNGTSYVCATPAGGSTAPTLPTIPNCASGEVLTGINGALACTAVTTAAPEAEVGSWCGYVEGYCPSGTRTSYNKKVACNGVELNLPCEYMDSGEGGAWSAVPPTNCPIGYYGVLAQTGKWLGSFHSMMGACVKDGSVPHREPTPSP
jgi:hypothetical protein